MAAAVPGGLRPVRLFGGHPLARGVQPGLRPFPQGRHRPDWGYFPRILAPLWATVQMSVAGTALGALLALGGDMGCSGGPTLVGLAAGFFGDSLKAGLAFAMVFPAALATLCTVYRRGRR